MLDEVSLIVVELVVPVVQIGGEVDLLRGPERSLSLLVHLPDLPSASVRLCRAWNRAHLSVLDREEDESRGGLLEQRFVLLLDVNVADESLAVLLDVVLLVLDDRERRLDSLLGGSSLQLGEQGTLGGLAGVEVDGGESRGSDLGRSLDGSHGECVKGRVVQTRW